MILNKILNEKKNNHLPEDWFCNHLLKNFLNVCKRMGYIENVKIKLIKFIQEYGSLILQYPEHCNYYPHSYLLNQDNLHTKLSYL